MSNLERRRLIQKVDVKPFRRVDDRLAFAAIALDYVIIVASAVIASRINRIPITLLALVVIAGRQSALQGLVHSAAHLSLFSRKKHNVKFQFLFAYPILDSVPLYREQHLEHHRDFALGTPDRFDYLYNCLELSREGVWSRTWVVFIRPLFGHAGYVFVTDAVRNLSADLKQACKLVIYWIALFSVAWLSGHLWFFLIYWVLPLVWLYPIFDIWAELSDHLDAKGESRNQVGLFYSMLFKGHETYHAVHHLFPFVPFYRLREVDDRLREKGVVMESTRGSIDFMRIVYRGRSRQPNRKDSLDAFSEHSPSSKLFQLPGQLS